jgi:hypothetical protein
MNQKTMSRTYSELRSIQTFEDRYRYLALRGIVGESTFGFDRWVNQAFYTSKEWREVRHEVIARDNGCDMGVPGYEIHKGLYIHHLNPMTLQQIESGDPCILDPENLITVSHNTHNAIHYGDERMLPKPPVVRRPGDTKLW